MMILVTVLSGILYGLVVKFKNEQVISILSCPCCNISCHALLSIILVALKWWGFVFF